MRDVSLTNAVLFSGTIFGSIVGITRYALGVDWNCVPRILTGVFVPVPTFFKTQSESKSLQPEVDVQTQVEHSVFLAKNGVRGLVLLGSTGEAIHMSRQERIDLISGVRKGLDEAGFKDYPIMAGTLINSVDETLEWLEDFKKAGAQWGLVLAPGYFGAAASQGGIREWYTVVADKSPLPVLMHVSMGGNTFASY